MQLLSGGTAEDGTASKLSAWFVRAASPGDAALAADALFAVFARRQEPITGAVLPMMEWLVLNGAAELRASRRGTLLHSLVVALDSHGAAPEVVIAALRYVSVSDDNLAEQYPGFHEVDALLHVVERALERGGSSQMVPALASRLGEIMTEVVLDVPEGGTVYPRVRRAILNALMAGLLGPASWKWAFSCPFPEPSDGLVFASAAAVDLALEAMRAHASLTERRTHSQRSNRRENEVAWSRFITGEIARIYNLADGLTARERHCLEFSITQSEPLAVGIGQALRNTSVKGTTLPRRILGEGLTQWHVAAALAALPTLGERRDEGPDAIGGDEVCDVLERLVRWPWSERVVGVDMAALLRGVTRVELAELSNDDKVAFDNEMLRLDRKAVIAALRVNMAHEERFGPAGGVLLLMVSGPPFSVVKVSELSPADGEILSSAADAGLDGERLAEIDGILRWGLTSMCDVRTASR